MTKKNTGIRRLFSKLAARAATIIAGQKYIPFDGWPGYMRSDDNTWTRILSLNYTYRATPDGEVTFKNFSQSGKVKITLYPLRYVNAKAVPGEELFSVELENVSMSDIVVVNLFKLVVYKNNKEVARSTKQTIRIRKFISCLKLTRNNKIFYRQCTHYLTYENRAIDEEYYYGADYDNYSEEVDIGLALKRLRQHCNKGRLLDVGCAMGLYTSAFRNAGFDAYGIDTAEFAINKALMINPSSHISCVDIQRSTIPFYGNFDIFWLWDVLEHFSEPTKALDAITGRAHRGSVLFIHTCNANSLLHLMLGDDWEGLTDYSHYGVRAITSFKLKEWLISLGWEIIEWECYGSWIKTADPVLGRFREVCLKIPEMDILLRERDLGDFIYTVCRKT